jgi:hypothetical protein
VEYNIRIESLDSIIKENKKNFKKNEEENFILKEKIKNFENFFDFKEEEFKTLILDKDKKLKDLEISIKKICNEASSQIENLNEIIHDYIRKNDEFLNNEKIMKKENMDLKQNLEYLLIKIKNFEEDFIEFEEEKRKNKDHLLEEVLYNII